MLFGKNQYIFKKIFFKKYKTIYLIFGKSIMLSINTCKLNHIQIKNVDLKKILYNIK